MKEKVDEIETLMTNSLFQDSNLNKNSDAPRL